MKIVLDPGHGGRDPGAAGFGLVEKDAALRMAFSAEAELKAAGHQTLLTRTDDRYVGIRERAAMAVRWDAGLLVSVHLNAGNPAAHGAEAFAAYGDFGSRELARTLLHSLSGLYGGEISLRGVKWDTQSAPGRLGVLRGAFSRMPAVLVELGFLTSAFDSRVLTDPKLGVALGQAIVRVAG